MNQPTPEEIAKVHAWYAEQRRKEVFARLIDQYAKTNKLTEYMGISIDETWPKDALVAMVTEAYHQGRFMCSVVDPLTR